MALTLTSSLKLHQRGTKKTPRISATVTSTHFGVHAFPVFPGTNDNGEASAPVSAAISSNGNQLLIVRNDAGSLDLSDDFGATWTNLDTVTAGQGFAIAYDPVADETLLVYADGTALKLRTDADSFAASTTLVTEASAIGAVALAVRTSNGNACAFYAIGTSSTVKRLRRTAGTWDASGTTWSRTADAATITGLAASWSTDYQLAITGTEATSLDEKLWAAIMGDGGFPSNTWSGLNTIAEADAAAATTFAYPAIASVGAQCFVTFQQTESGDVAAARVMFTTTTETNGPTGFWREPAPFTWPVPSDHGAAIAYVAEGFLPGFYIVTGTRLYVGPLYIPADLSPRVLSCSWRETPTTCTLDLELDDHDGNALDADGNAVPIWPGLDLTVTFGFASGTDGATESGVSLRLPIARVTRRFRAGKATVLVEADGPWEHLARFRASQAWTSPSLTRGQVFLWLAGRAGIEVVDATGARAPSSAWSTDTPAFAIAAGERGDATLRRLLAPTPDMLRIATTSGAFQICGGLAAVEAPAASDRYVLPVQSIAVGDHPLLELESIWQYAPDWIRLQGPDRYADAFAFETAPAAGTVRYALPPQMEHIRDLSASSDALATAGASGGLLRALVLTPIGRLVAEADLGVELYDPVQAEILGTGYIHQLNQSEAVRVISRGQDYQIARPRPRFTSALTFGPITPSGD